MILASFTVCTSSSSKGTQLGLLLCVSALSTRIQCFLGGEACAKASPVQVSQDTPGPPHIHSSNRQNFNATSKESVGSAWLTRERTCPPCFHVVNEKWKSIAPSGITCVEWLFLHGPVSLSSQKGCSLVSPAEKVMVSL